MLLTVVSKCARIYTVQEICGRGGTGRRAGLRNQCQRRGGSSPLVRTNDVSVRTNRTDRYKYHSEMDGIFLLQKYNLFSVGVNKFIASQSPRVLNVGQNS